jgi:hypothetical protein
MFLAKDQPSSKFPNIHGRKEESAFTRKSLMSSRRERKRWSWFSRKKDSRSSGSSIEETRTFKIKVITLVEMNLSRINNLSISTTSRKCDCISSIG